MKTVFDNGGYVGVYSDIPNRPSIFPVPTSGLVMYLDADSYTSSSTWYDLSGNGNNMALTGSPTYSSTYKSLIFSNSSQSANIPGLTSYYTANFSIVAASRYISGGSNGRIISSAGTNWLFGHWSGNCQSYYANGWVYGPTGGVDQNWRIYAATENYAANQRSFYINGSAMVTNSASGSTGFSGLGINVSEAGSGEVGFIALYNRLLSASEISTIYSRLRSRFGL